MVSPAIFNNVFYHFKIEKGKKLIDKSKLKENQVQIQILKFKVH